MCRRCHARLLGIAQIAMPVLVHDLIDRFPRLDDRRPQQTNRQRPRLTIDNGNALVGIQRVHAAGSLPNAGRWSVSGEDRRLRCAAFTNETIPWQRLWFERKDTPPGHGKAVFRVAV
jgi:hypothetical protein